MTERDIEDEKLVIFGWIVTVLGLPENADPTKYNELTDRIFSLINTYVNEARIAEAEYIQKNFVSVAGGYCDEISPDAIPNRITELKSLTNKGSE